MIRHIIIGEHKQSTAVRYEVIEAYETYNVNIDCGYDAEEYLNIGYFCDLSTPEDTMVDRSSYGKITEYKQDIVAIILVINVLSLQVIISM